MAIGFWWLAASAVLAIQALIQRGRLNGARLLEQHPLGYTSDQAQALLSRLGPSGRAWYAGFQAVDVVLIVALANAMVATDRWGIARGVGGPLRFGPALPVVYAVVDLAEDLILVRMIAAYPNRGLVPARVASAITATKFVTLAAAAVAMVAILAEALAKVGDRLAEAGVE